MKRPARLADRDAFERKLFVMRRVWEKRVNDSALSQKKMAYIPSLSCYTMVYKGMLTPEQLEPYFPDLSDVRLASAFAMVHSRFSTNTFPSWELAHPYRMIAHNGEINTLRGNINWMKARQSLLQHTAFEAGDLDKLLPLIRDGLSDTGTIDAVIELLIKGGRAPAHVMMMLIPEAWETTPPCRREKKDFYAYHACFMEPWDGPASIAFTDGKTIGATLDRNGLRPSRYWVTDDDLVIMASEVGVLDVAPEKIVKKGRLEPGRMFLIDMEQGRIVGDEELKHSLATAQPYGEWLAEHMAAMADVPSQSAPAQPRAEELLRRQQAFGYTQEDHKYILGPMANQALWSIGSMGNDAPLAVLSDRPQVLYNYFKQLFAQVTNPPLDCIREELVTAVLTNLGPHDNLLAPGPRAAHQIRLDHPLLSNAQAAALKGLAGWHGFRSVVLPAVFRAADGAAGMERALEALFEAADEALAGGANILILSDRGVDADHAPLPSLLACAGLHHHLVRNESRTRTAIVVESGDVREVHHYCCLLGYGADAIAPWVALDSIRDLHRRGRLADGLTADEAEHNYEKAVIKGVVKVMARMGISTIQSYRGAQILRGHRAQ